MIETGLLLAAAALLLLALAVLPRHSRTGNPDPLAEARADRLLRDVLTPGEYAQLVARGYLEVPSRSRPGRTYRIPSTGGPVLVREKGAASVRLCLQPKAWLPGREVVLVHKLLLEGAETEYWRRANVFPAAAMRGWSRL